MAVEPLREPDSAAVTEFRRVAGRFASGICVAATVAEGLEYAMTVSAFASVSLDPLLVLICVEKTARFHRAVRLAGAWALSILPEGAEPLARWFAAKGRPTGAQFADVGHHPSSVTGMPVLDDAVAMLGCRTWAWYDGGDHDIVVGEVVEARLIRPDARPLVHFAGGYHRLADEHADPGKPPR